MYYNCLTKCYSGFDMEFIVWLSKEDNMMSGVGSEPMPTSAMPPSAVKEYKLKCYAERHAIQLLRRLASWAEKAAK